MITSTNTTCPVFFNLYLVQAPRETHDSPGLPVEMTDHTYSKTTDLGSMLSLQYADDIYWTTGNCAHGITEQKDTIPYLWPKEI